MNPGDGKRLSFSLRMVVSTELGLPAGAWAPPLGPRGGRVGWDGQAERAPTLGWAGLGRGSISPFSHPGPSHPKSTCAGPQTHTCTSGHGLCSHLGPSPTPTLTAVVSGVPYWNLVKNSFSLFPHSLASGSEEVLRSWGALLRVYLSHVETLKHSKGNFQFHLLFSHSVVCPTLCDPMDCSTPGLPVHHQLPEFTQTRVH